MKVLLTAPRIYLKRQIPLGIAYIAAYLRNNGHEVRVFDPFPWNKNDTFDKAVVRFKPDIVGISCTTPQFIKGLEYAAIVKKIDKSIKVVFGGVHVSSDPINSLKFENVDYIVKGEGEIPFLKLCDALEGKKDINEVPNIGYRKSNEAHISKNIEFIKNLDDLPMPARDLFPMKWYSQRSTSLRGKWLSLTNVMSSRGCPWNCIFCASNTVFGRMFRAHSVKRVVDEVESVINKYKLEGIYFSDDTFAVNMKRAMEICQEIRNRKLDIVWRAQLRADTITDELVKEMAKAGCLQIEFGVESGSDKVLKNVNKELTTAQLYDAFRICKKHNVRTMAHFMINNPGETKEDIELTRKFAHKINADFTEFHICTPFPGTKIYEMAKENRWLKEDISYENYFTDFSETSMEINFPSSEIIKMRDSLRSEFIANKVIGYLKQPRFIFDMALFNLFSPSVPLKAMKKFITTRKLEDSLRVIENAQRSRKFP